MRGERGGGLHRALFLRAACLARARVIHGLFILPLKVVTGPALVGSLVCRQSTSATSWLALSLSFFKFKVIGRGSIYALSGYGGNLSVRTFRDGSTLLFTSRRFPGTCARARVCRCRRRRRLNTKREGFDVQIYRSGFGRTAMRNRRTRYRRT